MKIAISTLLIALLAAAGLVAALVYSGAINFAADEPHAGPVYRLIETARERFIASRAEDIEVPDLDDPRTIAEGGAHYVPMCSGCHLGPDTEDTEIRLGLYPQPPKLADPSGRDHEHGERGQSAARQFWIIKHGIKLTAMPAWGTTHDDAEIWALVAFLQKLPEMSAEQYAQLGEGGHSHSHEADRGDSDEPPSPSPDHVDPPGAPPHQHGEASRPAKESDAGEPAHEQPHDH